MSAGTENTEVESSRGDPRRYGQEAVAHLLLPDPSRHAVR